MICAVHLHLTRLELLLQNSTTRTMIWCCHLTEDARLAREFIWFPSRLVAIWRYKTSMPVRRPRNLWLSYGSQTPTDRWREDMKTRLIRPCCIMCVENWTSAHPWKSNTLSVLCLALFKSTKWKGWRSMLVLTYSQANWASRLNWSASEPLMRSIQKKLCRPITKVLRVTIARLGSKRKKTPFHHQVITLTIVWRDKSSQRVPILQISLMTQIVPSVRVA